MKVVVWKKKCGSPCVEEETQKPLCGRRNAEVVVSKKKHKSGSVGDETTRESIRVKFF